MRDLSEYLKFLLAVKEETQKILDLVGEAEKISKHLGLEPLDLARKVASVGVGRVKNLLEKELD